MISDVMEDNVESVIKDYFFGNYVNIGVSRLIQDARRDKLQYFYSLWGCNLAMYEDKQRKLSIERFSQTKLFNAYHNLLLFRTITTRMKALYEGIHDALR